MFRRAISLPLSCSCNVVAAMKIDFMLACLRGARERFLRRERFAVAATTTTTSFPSAVEPDFGSADWAPARPRLKGARPAAQLPPPLLECRSAHRLRRYGATGKAQAQGSAPGSERPARPRLKGARPAAQLPPPLLECGGLRRLGSRTGLVGWVPIDRVD